jgi:hypothetical protein
MRRKKRFTIRLVALGFAAAAIAAPAAQAIPEGMNGTELRALQSGGERVVSPDDRTIHGTHPQVIKSPDDRPIHATASVKPTPQPVSVTDDDGINLSNGEISSIAVALLAALMAGYAVYQVRKAGKLASV